MPQLEPTQVVWRKSRHSKPDEDCIEVAVTNGSVWLRDSKNPEGPTVILSVATWNAFMSRARSGELDL